MRFQRKGYTIIKLKKRVDKVKSKGQNDVREQRESLIGSTPVRNRGARGTDVAGTQI